MNLHVCCSALAFLQLSSEGCSPPSLSGNFVLQVVAYALLRHSLSAATVMTHWNILHVNKPEEIQHDFNPFFPALMLSVIVLK